MKRIISTLILFALPAVATAAVKIEGETEVPEHKMVRLSVKLDAGRQADWDVQPADNVDMEILSDGRLLFTGPPGKYAVRVLVIDFDSKKFERGSVRVTIGPADPVPVPDPKPKPPGPNTDTLWGPLSLAYASDNLTPNKADCAAKMAQVYRRAAAPGGTCFDASLPTNTALVRKHSENISKECPWPYLQTVREEIAKDLDKKMGTTQNVPLTVDSRSAYATQFNRVAGLLEQLK